MTLKEKLISFVIGFIAGLTLVFSVWVLINWVIL